MKKASTFLLLTLFVLSLATGAPKKYGKDLTVKEVTKISAILAEPEKFKGKTVVVEGPVVDVCSERGCWIKIGSDKEFEMITFKVEDGVIVFPMTEKGKQVRAEGTVFVKHYTNEELIKQGEEMAKKEGKKFDPATVKGPKTTVRLNGVGAEIK